MKVFVALCSLVGASAAAASAANEKTSRAETLDGLEDRMALSRFGDCVVQNSHVDASAAILNNYTYEEIARSYPGLIDKQCLDLWPSARPLSTRVHLIQYAIADALVKYERLHSKSFNVKSVPALQHKFFGPREQFDIALSRIPDAAIRRRVDSAAAVTTRFGECVVRADILGSINLLSSTPGSLAEKTSIKTLQKAGNHCAGSIAAPRPFGERYIDFTPISFRGGVAVSYYRLALANRTAAREAR